MKQINVNLTWKELHDVITQRVGITFIATRSDIRFDNIETDLPGMDVDNYFTFDIIGLPGIKELLSYDALGLAEIPPFSKVQFYVKLLGGNIWYKRIGKGIEWEVVIAF